MAAAAPWIQVPQASIYVGDLHPDVTEAMVYDHFVEFTGISSVRLCVDSTTGRSLGYAYVNFTSSEDATRAIEAKNHSILNGKEMRVTWSLRDSESRKSGVGNVFVKNLCDSIDSVKLHEIFEGFGKILSSKVAMSDDGKSKGYGFVQFELGSSADAAIEKLNGSNVEGKQLYVGKFVKKSDRIAPRQEVSFTNLYVKNLDTNVSDEVLQEKFSPYGKIVSIVISKDEDGASKGFGFVNFEKPDDAKRAIEALHGSQLGSKVLYVARAQKKSEREEMLRHKFEEKRREQILKFQASNVYVKNIDDDITEDELRERFSQCGIITSAKLMKDDKGLSKGFGFVCFSTPEEAHKAINTCHGVVLRRKPLYVAMAQRKEERKAQLRLKYAQRMAAGLSGQSAVIPGGYSPFYFPPPGVIPQFHTQPGMMFHPFGMRPGWRPNGLTTPTVPLVANNPRHPRQYRGRMNWPLSHSGGQQSTHAVHDSNYQQRAGHIRSTGNGRSREMNKASVAEGSQTLSSVLAAAPPERQKVILGEKLYPLIQQLKPDQAAKITGMLLEMDNSELLLLLDSPESLAVKVEEAVEVLKLSKAKMANRDSLRSNFISSQVAVN